MNRIILAYCPANADIARHIDSQLSRIGIPFEHMPAQEGGNWATAVFTAGEPVLLLVTDNLLTERSCMSGLLPVLQQFPQGLSLLPVVAPGKDSNGNEAPTSIERMVNMLHYMNHWQNAWLDISAKFQEAHGEERAAWEKELDAVRLIANQTGDIITILRERGATTIDLFESNDYALFFDKFGLSDWHGQYKRLSQQAPEPENKPASGLLPETPLHSGLLTPEPVEEIPEEPGHVPAPLVEDTVPSEPHETPAVEPELPQTEPIEVMAPQTGEDLVDQAVRDAQFWIDRGFRDRGIELLKLAAEEFPGRQSIIDAYQAALHPEDTAPEPEAPLLQPEASPEPLPAIEKEEVPVQTPDAGHDGLSYQIMGDVAYNKGDYLFAKYCWDRAVELDPSLPGIYRKLALMTAEHLQDYRETAVVYLKKALEIDPDDAVLKTALARLAEAPAQVETNAAEQEPEAVQTEPLQPVVTPAPDMAPENTAVHDSRPGPLVFITGATSGIGRATAVLFAQKGYRLVLAGRRVERLVEVKNELESTYQSDVLLLPFDVRNAGAVQSAFDSIPEGYRDIDVLVNNAGLAKGLAPIHEGSLDHWETMIDTNVKGLLYVTRLVSQGMVARRKGHIINVGSSAGKEVYPNGNVYCATKFAVDALTRAIRYDLHKFNIRVSEVSPGHVEDTEFAINRFDGDAERAKIYEGFQPLKPQDVAEAIWFMVSRPAHVNIQDVFMFGTQQASSTIIDRSGRS